MDLDQKWQWVSRKLPRRVIPPGQLLETKGDGRGLICDQLGISQSEAPSSQQLCEGDLSARAPEAVAMASRRGGSGGQQQAVRRNPHKKFSPPLPKSPPRRVILNQKLERVRAALKNTAGMVEADVGKASGGGSRGVSCAGDGEEEEDEDEDRRRTLLAALMEVEGAKKQRPGASTKKNASSSSSTPSSVRRASTMTVTSGGTKGSGAGAATKPTKTTPTTAQPRGSTHLQDRGSLHGTAAFDSTSNTSGAMVSTGGGGGARGTKGVAAAAAAAGSAVEHEHGGIQLKPPTPIDHRRKSRLPDCFGEGDEKSLDFNLRNLHLFPQPRTPLEGVGEEEGGQEGGATTRTAPRSL
jgi:hypothetical protein